MTPHLHPRSRLTSSLFGTTLLVSFLVVGMPHILPCPAPRIKLADAEFEVADDGRRRRRRRTLDASVNEELNGSNAEDRTQEMADEEKTVARRSHECPVPKPRGLIGEVLGFKKEGIDEKPPRPRIETGKLPRSGKEDA